MWYSPSRVPLAVRLYVAVIFAPNSIEWYRPVCQCCTRNVSSFSRTILSVVNAVRRPPPYFQFRETSESLFDRLPAAAVYRELSVRFIHIDAIFARACGMKFPLKRLGFHPGLKSSPEFPPQSPWQSAYFL
jgi:hypothetical protein